MSSNPSTSKNGAKTSNSKKFRGPKPKDPPSENKMGFCPGKYPEIPVGSFVEPREESLLLPDLLRIISEFRTHLKILASTQPLHQWFDQCSFGSRLRFVDLLHLYYKTGVLSVFKAILISDRTLEIPGYGAYASLTHYPLVHIPTVAMFANAFGAFIDKVLELRLKFPNPEILATKFAWLINQISLSEVNELVCDINEIPRMDIWFCPTSPDDDIFFLYAIQILQKICRDTQVDNHHIGFVPNQADLLRCLKEHRTPPWYDAFQPYAYAYIDAQLPQAPEIGPRAEYFLNGLFDGFPTKASFDNWLLTPNSVVGRQRRQFFGLAQPHQPASPEWPIVNQISSLFRSVLDDWASLKPTLEYFWNLDLIRESGTGSCGQMSFREDNPEILTLRVVHSLEPGDLSVASVLWPRCYYDMTLDFRALTLGQRKLLPILSHWVRTCNMRK